MAKSKIRTDKTPVDLLTRKQAEAEYARLQADIATHDKLYYQQDRPSITDAEYDELRRRYNAIEARFPDLRTLESLSLKVGAAPARGFAKVRHAVPMLSISSDVSAASSSSTRTPSSISRPNRRSTACLCRCATRRASLSPRRRAATARRVRTLPPISAPLTTCRRHFMAATFRGSPRCAARST